MSPITPTSSAVVDSAKRLFIVICIGLCLGVSFWLIWVEQHRVVPIVMYHHIDDIGKHPVSTVPVDQFEKHLQYLQYHQFEVLPFDEFLRKQLKNEPLSRKTIVLTLDDGYEDNYTNAFPLLKKYNFPATMFISTEKVGLPGYVTWDQLREMAAAGISIGSHAVRHEYLPNLSRDQIVEEVRDSRRVLEQQLGISIRNFSYPVGGFNDEIKFLVRQAGYQSAVTTNRGYDRYNHDPFELNRVTMGDGDVLGPIRWVKFSGYYNLFRKSRQPQ